MNTSNSLATGHKRSTIACSKVVVLTQQAAPHLFDAFLVATLELLGLPNNIGYSNVGEAVCNCFGKDKIKRDDKLDCVLANMHGEKISEDHTV